MESTNGSKNILLGILGSAVASLFLLLGDTLGGFIEKPVSYLYTPMSFLGDRYGIQTKDYFTLLDKVVEFKKEIEDVKGENLELKNTSEYASMLEKENESLKRQLNLANKESVYVETEILEGEYGLESDYAVLNGGSDEKIEVGDSVVLGNIYIGKISKVGIRRSVVLQPTNTLSRIKVFVVRPFNINNKDEEKISALESKGVDAVAIGTGGGIVLENILADSGVKPGDIVVTSDQRILGHYIVGKVKSVDRDPAAALIEAEVEPLHDFDALSNVFIAID